MNFLQKIEQFTNSKKANLDREYEMIQGGSPKEPELAVNALLGLAARLINKYDNSSFTAENDHQMFRELVGPLLISLKRRTGLQVGGVYIDYDGSSSADKIPGSNEYRFESTNLQRPANSVSYDAWIQNDNGVANLYAKTV